MHKFYILLLLLSNALAFSQNGKALTDKEYYSLQEESRRHLNGNRDSSFILADKIEKSNKYLHKAFARGIKSYVFQLKGDSIKAKEFYKTALVFLNKEKNSTEKLKIQSYLINFEGLSEWKRGNLKKALDCFEKGKKISVKIDDKLQNIKFSGNIAHIYSEIGKYNVAIKGTKEVLFLVEKNIAFYDEDQFNAAKNLYYLHLGWYYQEKFQINKRKKIFLDSSTYYYEKSLLFSDDFLINKINAQKSIGINHLLNKESEKGLNTFNKTLVLINDNNMQIELANIHFNIGYIYFSKGNYTKSLIYFKKNDSLYNIDKKLVHILDYINSNYYQAKIYQKLGNLKEANRYSKIYDEQYESNREYLDKNKLDLLNKMSNESISKEMLTVQEKYNKEFLLEILVKGIVVLIILILIFLLLKSYRDKKRIVAKVNLLIDETKKINNIDNISFVEVFKKSIQISNEEETDILKKIKIVNEKKDYLKQEFSQQYIAKKLKTNTTYLSYIFNKVYNKTFSNYYNELRLDFVVNEILNNKKYREYSTQAIAESAGFKNADSFTVSFKKKTGLTPYQFINEIKKRD